MNQKSDAHDSPRKAQLATTGDRLINLSPIGAIAWIVIRLSGQNQRIRQLKSLAFLSVVLWTVVGWTLNPSSSRFAPTQQQLDSSVEQMFERRSSMNKWRPGELARQARVTCVPLLGDHAYNEAIKAYRRERDRGVIEAQAKAQAIALYSQPPFVDNPDVEETKSCTFAIIEAVYAE